MLRNLYGESCESSSVWHWNSATRALKNRNRLTVGETKPVWDLFNFQCRVGDRPAAHLLGKIEEAGFFTLWARYAPRKPLSLHTRHKGLPSSVSGILFHFPGAQLWAVRIRRTVQHLPLR